jgi:hypothetical protein
VSKDLIALALGQPKSVIMSKMQKHKDMLASVIRTLRLLNDGWERTKHRATSLTFKDLSKEYMINNA